MDADEKTVQDLWQKSMDDLLLAVWEQPTVYNIRRALEQVRADAYREAAQALQEMSFISADFSMVGSAGFRAAMDKAYVLSEAAAAVRALGKPKE